MWSSSVELWLSSSLGFLKCPPWLGRGMCPGMWIKKSQECFLTCAFFPSTAYQISFRQFVLISSESPFRVQHLLPEVAAMFLVPCSSALSVQPKSVHCEHYIILGTPEFSFSCAWWDHCIPIAELGKLFTKKRPL